MKTVCMIPVRAGSKRIPDKNIRMLNGKPLVAYAIEAAKAAGIFSAIYLNSEDEIFREIAEDYGIEFYHRKKELASDNTTNDEFAYDFMCAVECDYVFQLLCTSPFITASDIIRFNLEFERNTYNTLIATKRIQIECTFGGLELNYHRNEHTKPSQHLEPVHAYACSMMMWMTKMFKHTFKNGGGAYHGHNSATGYFELQGLPTIDIDYESDFILAEQIMKSLSQPVEVPKYYKSRRGFIKGKEDQATMIGDGISLVNFKDQNQQTVSIPTIISQMPKDRSWTYRLIGSQSGCATLIAQLKDERNRKHYHNDVDEWWRIEQGEYRFDIGNDRITASTGDVVFVPRNTVHQIFATAEGLSIRLAVSKADVEHIFVE